MACDIECIYQNAFIPTIHLKKVCQKVASVLQPRRNAVNNLGIDQRTGKVGGVGGKKSKGKLKMSEVAGNLFEVQSCVPEREHEFYNDQNEKWKLYITLNCQGVNYNNK